MKTVGNRSKHNGATRLGRSCVYVIGCWVVVERDSADTCQSLYIYNSSQVCISSSPPARASLLARHVPRLRHQSQMPRQRIITPARIGRNSLIQEPHATRLNRQCLINLASHNLPMTNTVRPPSIRESHISLTHEGVLLRSCERRPTTAQRARCPGAEVTQTTW
jgi:hypothetical protein